MDNRYFKEGCPALMSDGRFITSYVDSDILNQYIRHVNEINSAHDFKNFLQKNANEIMDKERKFITDKNTCKINKEGCGCGKNIEGFASIGDVNVRNSCSNKCRFGCTCNN